jgi:hypothetical protein
VPKPAPAPSPPGVVRSARVRVRGQSGCATAGPRHQPCRRDSDSTRTTGVSRPQAQQLEQHRPGRFGGSARRQAAQETDGAVSPTGHPRPRYSLLCRPRMRTSTAPRMRTCAPLPCGRLHGPESRRDAWQMVGCVDGGAPGTPHARSAVARGVDRPRTRAVTIRSTASSQWPPSCSRAVRVGRAGPRIAASGGSSTSRHSSEGPARQAQESQCDVEGGMNCRRYQRRPVAGPPARGGHGGATPPRSAYCHRGADDHEGWQRPASSSMVDRHHDRQSGRAARPPLQVSIEVPRRWSDTPAQVIATGTPQPSSRHGAPPGRSPWLTSAPPRHQHDGAAVEPPSRFPVPVPCRQPGPGCQELPGGTRTRVGPPAHLDPPYPAGRAAGATAPPTPSPPLAPRVPDRPAPHWPHCAPWLSGCRIASRGSCPDAGGPAVRSAPVPGLQPAGSLPRA